MLKAPLKGSENKPHLQRWTFQSYSEYVSYVSTVGPYDLELAMRTSRDGGRDSWFGNASWDETVRMTRDGWPAGRKMIEERAERFRTDVRTSIGTFAPPQLVHGVVGAFPDVGRFVNGEPESMVSWEHIEQQHDIVRIVINGGTSGAVSGEAITNKGAAVCALIDLLEESGKRVEVTYLDIWTDSRNFFNAAHWHECVVPVKEAGDVLQMDKMAFALAHPAAYRRLGFSFAERLDVESRRAIGVGHGYGAVVDASPTFDRGDIYIGSSGIKGSGSEVLVNFNDMKSAEQWIIRVLRAQGVLEDGD